jgi:hypothetical protein
MNNVFLYLCIVLIHVNIFWLGVIVKTKFKRIFFLTIYRQWISNINTIDVECPLTLIFAGLLEIHLYIKKLNVVLTRQTLFNHI